MNAKELSEFLSQRALEVAQNLLPNGKRVSSEWCAGDTSGGAGKSLKVRIAGDKKGVWSDFATGESGDLLDLWMHSRGVTLPEAMKEAMHQYGIRAEPLERPKKQYTRPEKPKCTTPKGKIQSWFADRGITEETIKAFKIGEKVEQGKTMIVFPYFKNGELINAKYRDIADKKHMRQEKNAEPCLFGWHLIDDKERTVAICEGEIDSLTLTQMGISALSVNQGAGNHQWIDNDWLELQRFSEIYLCYDQDEAGQKGVREVAQRLGLERCKIVKFDGFKDANDALKAGFSKEDFEECLKLAQTIDPNELKSITEFWGEVKNSFYPAVEEDETEPVLRFPFKDCDFFRFRYGEVTVWTGYNGHGKSLMLGQTLINLMMQGEKACVFSGEMLPKYQGKRLAKQISGLDRPSPEYLDYIGEWLQERMWIFNVADVATLSRLLEVFLYAFKRYGIRHFVIDSLMMIDVPEDGAGAMTAQKEAMRKIASFARTYQVHMHLVAHPRKGASDKQAPTKMDVAGSSKITDASDNVFSVWANHRDTSGEDVSVEDYDASLELHKQRNGDVQSKWIGLYFNKNSQQYTGDSRRKGYSYLDFSLMKNNQSAD